MYGPVVKPDEPNPLATTSVSSSGKGPKKGAKSEVYALVPTRKSGKLPEKEYQMKETAD